MKVQVLQHHIIQQKEAITMFPDIKQFGFARIRIGFASPLRLE